MGRFKALFKKEKPAPDPNPYAQQPPQSVAQDSPPPQYQQPYGQQQPVDQPPTYPGNRDYNQPQGLSPGQRTGAPPGQGAPRTGAFESNKAGSPGPPQYSPGGPATYPPTRSSPNYAPHSQKPQTNTGYPTEKTGALDGFGGNRFGNPAAPQHSGQRPGGYGSLDTPGDGLFANRPPKPTTTASYPQAGVSNGADGYAEEREMTQEEMEQAAYDQTVGQITEVLKASKGSSSRSVALIREAKEKAAMGNSILFRQGDELDHVEDQMIATGSHARKGQHQMEILRKAPKMTSFASNSNTGIQAQERRKMAMDRDREIELEAIARQRDVERREVYNVASKPVHGQPKALLGGRARNPNIFDLEENEEQGELNDSIEDDLQEISNGIPLIQQELNIQAAELRRQNLQLDRITAKTEQNQDQLVKNNTEMHARFLNK